MTTDNAWLTARPIAHRGLHDMNVTRYENTLSAFRAAVAGNYAIECDVLLSRDGVPVVFHDPELERLTGEKGLVIDRTAAELGRLPVGGTADTIPTLADALQAIAGAVPVVVELKGQAEGDAALVAAVARVLDGYRGRAAIMSFDHWLVERFRTDAPGIFCGLTAEGLRPDQVEPHYKALDWDIGFVSYNVHHLPNPFVSHVRSERGMPVITWTVRDRAAVERTLAFADQMTFEGFDPDRS